MKLITELNEEVQVLEEESDSGKQMYLKGVFLQAETVNRNGRVYPLPILQKEVERYNKEYIKENRAYGELGHPDGPTINLDRVSHMITELNSDGSNFIGKAKLLRSTPFGKVAEGLLSEGCKLGVSSRGMGTLKEVNGKNIVQDDYHLSTAADIVADPSAPNAFVDGIMEGKEWIWDNGLLKESDVEHYKYNIEDTIKRHRFVKDARQERFAKAFELFIENLDYNIKGK